jgi:tetratricopeptide (TPR) repeat protein
VPCWIKLFDSQRIFVSIVATDPILLLRQVKGALVLSALAAALLFSRPGFARQAALVKDYATENSVYKACLEGNKLMEVGSNAEARDLLLKSVACDPTSYSTDLHFELANCYKRLKNFMQAAAEAEASLKFNPNNRQAQYLLALTYNDMGKFDQAIKLLKKLAQESPDDAFAKQLNKTIKDITIFENVKQAEKYINLGRNSDAKVCLEKAAALDPSQFSASVHGNLSFVLERTGNPEQAIVEGKKTLQLNPTDSHTMYMLAISYQDLGDFDSAISWLRRYVSVETDSNLRDKANEFIQELADDRVKLNPKANSKPDYLEQLQEESAVQMWPAQSMPIKVYISPAKGVFGYRPVFKPFIVRSLNTWCDVSGKKLSYKLVDDKSKADMKVVWTREPLAMQESDRVRQKAGLTHVELNNDQKISDALVRIRTVNGFDPTKLITDGESASVSMHEIGHALGLGHSTCCSDIMYFGASSKQTGFPSKRDKATIARLYKDYPPIAFTPEKAPITTKTPIEYLPPPAFLPPEPTRTDILTPPMFMPPPAKSDSEKLEPPIFMPPPVKQAGSGKSQQDPKKMSLPLFQPPPLKKEKAADKIAPPLFVPPPK